MMLGTDRSGVAIAAGTLQKGGFIQYTHGTITIVDRAGLEDAVCECYVVARKQFDGLLRAKSPHADAGRAQITELSFARTHSGLSRCVIGTAATGLHPQTAYSPEPLLDFPQTGAPASPMIWLLAHSCTWLYQRRRLGRFKLIASRSIERPDRFASARSSRDNAMRNDFATGQVDDSQRHIRASRERLRNPSWAAFDRIQCSTAVSSASGPATAGGAFAESFSLKDGSIAIGVWAASGRGERAAARSRMLRAGYRTLVGASRDFALVARQLNRVLYSEVAHDSIPWPYVTGLFGLVDAETRVLSYVSCGHETAIQFSVDGKHIHLAPSGPALGIYQDADFRQDIARFGFGDTLAVVTPGITDARPLKSQTDFFGSRGLCALFQRSTANTAITATSLISRTIAFSDGRLDDDAAALIARFA